MLKNWQTSGAGIGTLLAAVASIVSSVSQGHVPDGAQVSILMMGIATGIGLLRAKDQNVTGGSVAQTPEAQRRVVAK
jgi:hypothetical protein